MYKISKTFHFSASHNLVGLAEDHPCIRTHGHNYKVKFIFQSNKLNANGFVIDYSELEPIKKFIDENLDHRHLNHVMDDIPTAENIAKMLYYFFHDKNLYPMLVAVEVSETDNTTAYFEPSFDIKTK